MNASWEVWRGDGRSGAWEDGWVHVGMATQTDPKSATIPKLVSQGERYSLLERARKINQPQKNKWLKEERENEAPHFVL